RVAHELEGALRAPAVGQGDADDLGDGGDAGGVVVRAGRVHRVPAAAVGDRVEVAADHHHLVGQLAAAHGQDHRGLATAAAAGGEQFDADVAAAVAQRQPGVADPQRGAGAMAAAV